MIKEIYIAEFAWGSPHLSRAELRDETDRRYYFVPNNQQSIIGRFYVPNFIDKKDYQVFFNLPDAIAYLQSCLDSHIIKCEEWRETLARLPKSSELEF